MDKILFFLNKSAGTSTPGNLQSEIKAYAEKHNFRYSIVELEKQVPFSELKAKVNDFDPTVAVAAGGDGTINLVASLIHGKDIKLGIIPAGSSNGMAFQLKIPSKPSEALNELVHGVTRQLDVLKINDKHICVHMSDLGMNARVIKRYEKDDQRGFLGYARQYFRELKNRRKFKFTLETETENLESKAAMIVLANSPYYGTGARIAPEGTPDDGWFELVVVRAYPNWFIFYMTLTLIIPKFSPKEFRETIRCRKVNIHLEEEQELQIDGEPMGKEEQIKAELIPGSLKVIMPG